MSDELTYLLTQPIWQTLQVIRPVNDFGAGGFVLTNVEILRQLAQSFVVFDTGGWIRVMSFQVLSHKLQVHFQIDLPVQLVQVPQREACGNRVGVQRRRTISTCFQPLVEDLMETAVGSGPRNKRRDGRIFGRGQF